MHRTHLNKFLISFMVVAWAFSSVSAYMLSDSDNTLATTACEKIERIIASKGEVYRSKYSVALKNYSKKFSGNERMQAIINLVESNISTWPGCMFTDRPTSMAWGQCEYESHDGVCEITSIKNGDYSFSFTPSASYTATQKGILIPANTGSLHINGGSCSKEWVIKLGMKYNCKQELIKSGTCSPRMFVIQDIGSDCSYVAN